MIKNEYYSYRNRDVATGLQTQDVLEDPDLHDIAKDLERKGLLGESGV